MGVCVCVIWLRVCKMGKGDVEIERSEMGRDGIIPTDGIWQERDKHNRIIVSIIRWHFYRGRIWDYLLMRQPGLFSYVDGRVNILCSSAFVSTFAVASPPCNVHLFLL